MPNVLLETDGAWENTRISVDGEIPRASIFTFKLFSGNDPNGDQRPGFHLWGGGMVGLIQLEGVPIRQRGIFPGRLDIRLPGHHVVVENTCPSCPIHAMSVCHNGRDVTEQLMDLIVEINSADTGTTAYITLCTSGDAFTVETETFTLL